MGLHPDQFYTMTWKDYNRAAQGYWIRNGRFMEGVRRLAYYTVIMNGDPKKVRSLKEKRLFQVNSDLITEQISIPIEKKRVTAEQLEAIKMRYKKDNG